MQQSALRNGTTPGRPTLAERFVLLKYKRVEVNKIKAYSLKKLQLGLCSR